MIDRYWSDNAPDHPVIMKTLYGLSWRAFHRCTCTGAARGLHPIPVKGRHVTLPLFARESTAFRFPAILFAALLVGMVYRFARGWLPRPPAAAAAVLTLAQPHYFFHAQISCFDAPITTMAFAVGFAYWKSLRSPRWGIAAGVLFGIALGVKHNAWLMPIFLVGHYLWMRRGDLRARRIPRPPLAFVAMLVLGPIIFFAHWPWLWTSPGGADARVHQPPPAARALQLRVPGPQLEQSADDHGAQADSCDRAVRRDRVHGAGHDAGAGGGRAPSCWPAAGGASRSRRDGPREAPAADGAKPSWLRPGDDVDRAPGAFLLVQTLGPLAVLAVPSTPIFGGVKHFMTAMPYLAVVAGIGLARAGSGARRARCRRRERGCSGSRLRRSPRSCACPRWSRRGARIRTGCRTTTCSRADSPAGRRWG